MNSQEELLMWKRWGKSEDEIPRKCLFHKWNEGSTWYHRIDEQLAVTYTCQCRKCEVYKNVQYHKPRKSEVVDTWQT